MDQGLQGKENGLGLDSVIQGALAAGIPIPQVIQFIQSSFQNNQLQSFAQTPNQQLLAAVTNPAQLLNSSNASNVSGLGQLNAHSNLNFNLHALNQAQHQVHVASSQAPQSSLNSTINGAENGSLPWPIFQPAVHVPHFDMSTYQKVNLDAQASALPSGMDLPLHDMNTLRFFFNFGVHHARQILLREHFQLQPGQNHQQPTNSNVSVASQLGQQGQLMSSLSNQDLLYQQMLLKNSQDLTSGKPVGTPLPGSTSAVTDPRSAFQLQKDLANTILNKSQGLQIKNEPMENLLIQNSLLGAVSAARGVSTSAPQSTPLAILQRQQQAAQQGHQTHNQQRNQNQEPEVLRPQPVSLSDLTGSVQIQQLLQQQNLGGIGLSFQHQNKTLTAQVPVDPAPRPSVPSRDQDTGGVALTTSAGSTFPQKDAQDQADRMKPTAIVRGAVADVAGRSQNSPPKGSEANSSNQTPNSHSNGTPSQSSAMSSSQDTAAVAVANALVSQFGGVNGQVPSLAAQLSAAMVASTFMNPSKLPAASAASSNPLVNDNPDAHLLAGTSPYAKFPALAQSATRSLTSGNSGLTGESNNHSNNSELSEIKPESILQTSEQHFTEAFKRSLQQQMHGKNGKGSPKDEQVESPDRVQRKSGVNLMSLEKEVEKKKSADKPIPSMINYVNSCLTQIKSQVQSQGVGLPIDHNGRPIDYSSRPIDPIFRQAREKLEKDRDFSMIRRGSPSLHPPTTTQSPVDSCPIGISDSRSRSEQPQDIQQKVATLSPANSQRPRSTQPGAEGALENNNEDGPSESKKIKFDATSSESS